MAKIKDPLKELDVAELYDAYSYMELMWYEGLGLAPEGEGKQLIREGATSLGGAVAGLAIEASKYMHDYGATEKDGARVAVRERLHALNNPYAHLHQEWMKGIPPDQLVDLIVGSEQNQLLAYAFIKLDGEGQGGRPGQGGLRAEAHGKHDGHQALQGALGERQKARGERG